VHGELGDELPDECQQTTTALTATTPFSITCSNGGASTA
jgi:hypothetical protein